MSKKHKVLVIEVVNVCGEKEQFFQLLSGLERHSLSTTKLGDRINQSLGEARTVNMGVIEISASIFMALASNLARVVLSKDGHRVVRVKNQNL